MTKYVLNSGGIRNNPELAKEFFAEVVKGLGDSPRILICLFAQPREDWEKKFIDYQYTFFPDGVNPVFSLAFPEDFEEQIKESDVIFIGGGDDHLVMYWLRKFDIPKIWEGKVIATSSCSSHALSKYFWTCDWRKNMDGFGILSIKCLAHFESSFGHDDPRGPIDWSSAYKELKNYKEDLPIYALKEGEFKVFIQ